MGPTSAFDPFWTLGLIYWAAIASDNLRYRNQKTSRGLSSYGRVISCSSLQVLNRSSQCPSRHTGLGHNVVLLRCGECCVTEQVLDAADIDGITNRPERCGRMPKPMQVDRKAQCLLRSAPNALVNHLVIHGPTPADPQIVV